VVSPSRANDKAVRHLDERWKHAELDCNELNFFEIEFNLVVVEVKIFKIADSLSSVDLFFNVLLDQGDVHEPKVIGATE
jgi:hypothetical protein